MKKALRFPVPDRPTPALNATRMREVDRRMVEEYGVDLARMMEHAGRHLARLTTDRVLGGDPRGRRVRVLSGRGGNGGGALVAARRLAGWGARVEVSLVAPPSAMTTVPASQAAILERMGVPMSVGAPAVASAEPLDVVVDGVLGYSMRGAPRGAAAELIRWARGQDAPVVSLDTPSGVDCTTGEVPGVVVRALATVTLALPKTGLMAPVAFGWVGELYLVDIGVPPGLYHDMGMDVGPIFAPGEILRLR